MPHESYYTTIVSATADLGASTNRAHGAKGPGTADQSGTPCSAAAPRGAHSQVLRVPGGEHVALFHDPTCPGSPTPPNIEGEAVVIS